MRLLVTTDFSANSKGAIRFAQTMARQSNKMEVIFYYSVQFLKPTMWSDHYYKLYKEEEIKRITAELEGFVYSTIGKDKNGFLKIRFVVDAAKSTEKDMIKYAEQNKIDMICMSTRGAGILRKIMGTHTSYVVNHSRVPVLVIPSHYRSKQLKNITYLSDFENLKKEMDMAIKFSGIIKSSLDVLHYTSIILDKKKFDQNVKLFTNVKYNNIKLNLVKNNLELPLVERISQFVSKSKPELLVMYTKREKSFFEKIFLPSKSAELTYTTKVPVLIYSK